MNEHAVADLFPGLDRTFFKLFDWRRDPLPTVVNVKYQGTPLDARAAEVISINLTRRDPRTFSVPTPEHYELLLRLRTGSRELQHRLHRVLDEQYELGRLRLDYWLHQIDNAHVRDGDVVILFRAGPVAKHVATGLEITRALHDHLAAGQGLDETIAALGRPRAIPPPVIALPPPRGAKLH